ncbi:hypothetical protein [[Phormidium] sp. ETS-05]|nr:hypothetical protein [[Phormidium] sp. ETS-05]
MFVDSTQTQPTKFAHLVPVTAIWRKKTRFRRFACSSPTCYPDRVISN